MSFWEKEEVSEEILQFVVASFAKASFRDGAWAKPKRPEVLADVQRRLSEELSLRVEFFEELQDDGKFVRIKCICHHEHENVSDVRLLNERLSEDHRKRIRFMPFVAQWQSTSRAGNVARSCRTWRPWQRCQARPLAQYCTTYANKGENDPERKTKNELSANTSCTVHQVHVHQVRIHQVVALSVTAHRVIQVLRL